VVTLVYDIGRVHYSATRPKATQLPLGFQVPAEPALPGPQERREHKGKVHLIILRFWFRFRIQTYDLTNLKMRLGFFLVPHR